MYYTKKSIWYIGLFIFYFGISDTTLLSKSLKRSEKKLENIEHNRQSYEIIENLAKCYTRPITVLEIGSKKASYSMHLAANTSIVCAVLLLENITKSVVQEIKKHDYRNIVVLYPRTIEDDIFETLGRCEHFDIVIVHDIFSLLHKNMRKNMVDLLSLGDNTYIFTKWDQVPLWQSVSYKKLNLQAKLPDGLLLLCQDQKTELQMARWTQKEKARHLTPKYSVYSDFHKKLLIKNTADMPSDWIPGINLITFVMLQGEYPSDNIIRANLLAMRTGIPYHNDLVIGNIVIQGEKLAPIDLNDKRRNANMKHCLNSAIKLFNGDNSRFKNPRQRMDQYYRTI